MDRSVPTSSQLVHTRQRSESNPVGLEMTMIKSLFCLFLVSVVLTDQTRAQQNPIRGFFSNVMSSLGRVANRIGTASLTTTTTTVTETSMIFITITVTSTVIDQLPVRLQSIQDTTFSEGLLDTTINSIDEVGTEPVLVVAVPPIVLQKQEMNATSTTKTTATSSTTFRFGINRPGSRFFASLRQPKDEVDEIVNSSQEQDNVALEPSKVLS